MVEIYAMSIEGIDDTLYSQLIMYVGDERRKKSERYKFYNDRLRSVVSECLVRAVIGQRIDPTTVPIIFNVGPYGKPFVEDAPAFHFNISHSGTWVVCAVDNQPVGIDIEEIKPINTELARLVFSDEEKATLEALTGTEQLHYFYHIWTLKESYVKAIGLGLSHPLRSFSFQLHDGGAASIEPLHLQERYSFHRIDFQEKYKLSLCTSNSDNADNKEYSVIVKEPDFLIKALGRL
ncbi:4'-phosphopantetheinyl transferase family protein [Paenibacillus sp. IHBB 10380]|uniref:4'-phosphopantetheinyl transferase family protein n=1 Tax=Paenibacillus sp. IHBB 10380 TaxID=1566358 RepID=UPI0006984423|nr:4'-phosphopantetheinyl transferase superfamily protein [Paenibacillus sp. IHBB 10380]